MPIFHNSTTILKKHNKTVNRLERAAKVHNYIASLHMKVATFFETLRRKQAQLLQRIANAIGDAADKKLKSAVVRYSSSVSESKVCLELAVRMKEVK